MNAPLFFASAAHGPITFTGVSSMPPCVFRPSLKMLHLRRLEAGREFRFRRGQENINNDRRVWYVENRERVATYNRKHRQRLADDVFGAYGGYICACCSETEHKFLTIDHINNDGAAERRRLGRKGYHFYVWLREQGFPPGYRVLCINCNLGRQRNGGVCPHQIHG